MCSFFRLTTCRPLYAEYIAVVDMCKFMKYIEKIRNRSNNVDMTIALGEKIWDEYGVKRAFEKR